MKPAPFRYVRPKTLDEVVALLAAWAPDATLLSGGQSLLPLLNMRLARPAVLIDLALVRELQVLTRERDELVIGAGVRQRTAETSDVVREACPLLPLALHHVGYVQTRTRGTIGGSLAHADPTAELPCVAVALDAALVAVGPHGRRILAARDFFLGPFTTALEENEVLTEVRVPTRPEVRYAFCELSRRSAGPAIAGVAAAVRLDNHGNVVTAQLAALGAGPVPLRLAAAEEAARGGGLSPDELGRIAAVVDGTASEHRRRVIGTLVSRALAEVAA